MRNVVAKKRNLQWKYDCKNRTYIGSMIFKMRDLHGKCCCQKDGFTWEVSLLKGWEVGLPKSGIYIGNMVSKKEG